MLSSPRYCGGVCGTSNGMRNPLTLQIESQLGALFVTLFTLFMIGLIFIVIKNLNSDAIILDASRAEVKSISSTERQLISGWVKENEILIPEGEGYRYVVRQYPAKPWLNY